MKKKRKKRKLNMKRVIIALFLFCFIVYLFVKDNFKVVDTSSGISFANISSSFLSSITEEITKRNTNSNYPGTGQEKVENKDGYFTTFTTIENNKKVYNEYKQNGDSSWSSQQYWGGTMSDNGCGITSLSIILSGYNKQYTPEDLRKKYAPHLDDNTISNELLKTFGIKNSDFYYDSVHCSNDSIKKHLQSNRPILICVWNKPTANRWTTSSHFMVLLACDNNDLVYVSNPNGLKNTPISSGWYKMEEVTPYIAKALYINSYN